MYMGNLQMYLSELRGPSGNSPMKHPGSITRFVLPIVKEKNQAREF